MVRGLILGALAFGVTFVATKQFAAVSSDIERYNRIRAMSDDLPLFKQGLTMLRGALESFGNSKGEGAKGLIDSLQHDIVRYARISTM
jgi:hypothetical protein